MISFNLILFLPALQGLKRHIPTRVHVRSLNRCGLVEVELDEQIDKLCNLLKGGCVAARLDIYDSYNDLKGKVWILNVSLFLHHVLFTIRSP